MEHLIFWSLNVSVFNDTDLNVSLYKYKRLKTHLVKQNCLVILTNNQTNLWSTSAADTNLMNVEMTKYATKHKIRLHCYFHCYSWKGEKRRNRWLTGLTENIDWMHMRHHKEEKEKQSQWTQSKRKQCFDSVISKTSWHKNTSFFLPASSCT